jgi:hypothetical protein
MLGPQQRRRRRRHVRHHWPRARSARFSSGGPWVSGRERGSGGGRSGGWWGEVSGSASACGRPGWRRRETGREMRARRWERVRVASGDWVEDARRVRLELESWVFVYVCLESACDQ